MFPCWRCRGSHAVCASSRGVFCLTSPAAPHSFSSSLAVHHPPSGNGAARDDLSPPLFVFGPPIRAAAHRERYELRSIFCGVATRFLSARQDCVCIAACVCRSYCNQLCTDLPRLAGHQRTHPVSCCPASRIEVADSILRGVDEYTQGGLIVQSLGYCPSVACLCLCRECVSLLLPLVAELLTSPFPRSHSCHSCSPLSLPILLPLGVSLLCALADLFTRPLQPLCADHAVAVFGGIIRNELNQVCIFFGPSFASRFLPVSRDTCVPCSRRLLLPGCLVPPACSPQPACP
jgi:hypothetical protein